MFDQTKPIVNICTLGHAGYGKMLATAITKVLAPRGGATLVATDQIATEPIIYSTGNRYYVHSVPSGNNSDFTVALYQNLIWADSAILVVAVKEGVCPSLRLQLKVAQKHQVSTQDWNVSKLVVFLDTDGTNNDPGQLEALKSAVRSAIADVGFYSSANHPIPFISGSSRAALAAIDDQAPECQPIVELLALMDTTLPTPTRITTNTSLFMPIADAMLAPDGQSVSVTGCIERGRISLGDQVSLVGYSPQNKLSTVTQLNIVGNNLDKASAGYFVRLVLRGLTLADVQRGQALGGKIVSAFKCQVELIEPQNGYLALPLRDIEPQESMSSEVEEDVEAEVAVEADTHTEEELQTQVFLFDYDEIQILAHTATVTAAVGLGDNTNMLLGGDTSTVRITLKHPTPLAIGTPVVLVSKGRLIGVGKVEDIIV